MNNRDIAPDDDPEPIYLCGECLNRIYEGEEYFELDGKIICDCCLFEMSTRELFGALGYGAVCRGKV